MKGYFRKRGDKWSFTIDVGSDPASGKRKQKSRSGFSTKKEAQQACAELISQIMKGSYIAETRLTVKDFAETWLTEHGRDIKESSAIRKRHYIRALTEKLGAVTMNKVTRKQYQDFINGLELAPGTIRNLHATCRIMFRRAIEQEITTSDPTEFAKLPKPTDDEELPKYLEKEALARFLRATEFLSADSRIGLHILAYTGLRAGEMLALKWQDIDVEAGTLTVRNTYSNLATGRITDYTITPPKTKGSRRTISVDAQLIAMLNDHRKRQNEGRMRYRNRWHDENFILARVEDEHPGFPYVHWNVIDWMNHALRIAELPMHFTPHSLRHTHTSLLAEAGADLPAICARLGHKNDKTTTAVYLHVTKTVERETSAKFSALMANVVKM